MFNLQLRTVSCVPKPRSILYPWTLHLVLPVTNKHKDIYHTLGNQQAKAQPHLHFSYRRNIIKQCTEN